MAEVETELAPPPSRQRIGVRRQFSRLWQMPTSDTLALAEAAALLTFAQLLTKLVPFAGWARMLGRSGAGEVVAASNRDDGMAARRIARLIDTAARHLPSQPVCLPRAMAAKWMLASRRIPSELILGIRRPSAGDVRRTELHAWLQAGKLTVTGGDAADEFIVIACFGT